MKLSNLPVKGTADWFPEEFAVRKYIFDTWRKVCLRFGYEEYLTPLVESAEIYRAKSGEDVGGNELTVITDRGGRDLAIRPEMTPSVARLVTRKYNELPKPIRYFSIANFFRNQKPQRGRNREFWQLNADVFGSESVLADFEILSLALAIMLEFNPPKNSFTININDRKLIFDLISKVAKVSEDKVTSVARILDKYEKLDETEFSGHLANLDLEENQIEILVKFMQSNSLDELKKNIPEIIDHESFKQTISLIEKLNEAGMSEWINFNPSIIRGFDYYNGMVFEVFDNNETNKRSLFGGGRYNGLTNLFGDFEIPAVGFAPGDETLKIFLENWNLIPENIGKSEKIFVPILGADLVNYTLNVANEIRKAGYNVECGLDVINFKNAFSYANKKNFKFVVIAGEDELKANSVTIKNMETGEQRSVGVGEMDHVFNRLL